MDVARKVVILARECGIHVNLEDVEIESLVAPQLQQTPSSDAFLKGLPEVSCPLLHLNLASMMRNP